MRSIAIVTGASSGVGREFARQLDQGAGGALDELWLVARGAEHLEATRAQCSTPCRVFALDLTRPQSIDALAEALDEADARVCWLINSAGFGRFGSFGSISRDDEVNMVRLNCGAVVGLCHLALPHMDSGSCIINMSSVAGLAPQPELSCYSATKRFVLDLSRTLNYELEPVGIHVCAVCPKFMDTGFLANAGDARAVRRMTTIGYEQPRRVVRKALAAAGRGSATCVPSWDAKFIHVAVKLLPSALTLHAQDLLFTLLSGV